MFGEIMAFDFPGILAILLHDSSADDHIPLKVSQWHMKLLCFQAFFLKKTVKNASNVAG